MAKQGAADASQKPIDPSSLSITEALAGTFVATVFEFVQLKTVTHSCTRPRAAVFAVV